MKQAPNFEETLMTSLHTQITVEKWDEAKKAYEQNLYKDTILHLIDYVGIDIRKKYGNETNTYFKIPHGSIVVEIEITDDELRIQVPFLEIGEKQKIPLLRKIAEINFYPLNLSQIKLKDQFLRFQYTTPIHLCEPFKIYYILQEICHNADNLDDELISLFDVKLLHEPKITHYNENLLEKAWSMFNTQLSEMEEYMAYFDEKRIGYFNWDIINIALKRIEYLMAPSGKLRTDIEQQISSLYSQEDIQIRIQRGKKFIDKLKTMQKSDFAADMYLTETFIPIKARGDIEGIKNSWQKPFETATKEIQNQQYTAATLTLLLAFYNSYYHNNIDDTLNMKMMQILKNSGGQEWEKAANILYNGMDSIIKDKPPMKEKTASTKKSFFSKLFN